MLREVGGYRVGQYGPVDVLDSTGKRRIWVQGEIVRLISTANALYALIRTEIGTGVYRLW